MSGVTQVQNCRLGAMQVAQIIPQAYLSPAELDLVCKVPIFSPEIQLAQLTGLAWG